MSRPSIIASVNQLPTSNVTTTVLGALDFIVPGQWQNTTKFGPLVTEVTGVTDQDTIFAISRQADEMFASSDHYYRSALRVYSMVDTLDKAVAAAALANKVGSAFKFASVLERFTPKADTTQAIDAGLKFVAEVIAFAMLNGLPSPNMQSIGEFTNALKGYGREDIMRVSAWVVIDGMIPLGPNFMRIIAEQIQGTNSGALQNNNVFDKLASFLPGSSVDEKRNFIVRGISSAQGWVEGFVQQKGITREGVGSKLLRLVDVADNSLDYLGAALDGTTNYFQHTGTQTVARTVIRDAYAHLQANPYLLESASSRRDERGGGSSGGRPAPRRRGPGVGTAAAIGAAAAGAAAVGVAASRRRRDESSYEEQSYEGGNDYYEESYDDGSYDDGGYGADYTDRFAAYTTPESVYPALIDAMCLSAWADGEVAEEEHQTIIDVIAGLPAYYGYEDEAASAAQESFARIDSYGWDAILEETINALYDTQQAEDAFVMAAMIQYADGEVDSYEDSFLWDFGGRMGLEPGQMEQLMAEAEDHMYSGDGEDYYADGGYDANFTLE